MAGFFYAVDFGKLNQLLLAHIELVESTSSLSRAHRACREHIELVEMGTSTSLSVHLLSVHLDKENARLKNYHIFK
jgi:hypothetical protein